MHRLESLSGIELKTNVIVISAVKSLLKSVLIIHSSYLNTSFHLLTVVAVTIETENQTGRILCLIPYLGLCSISGNL